MKTPRHRGDRLRGTARVLVGCCLAVMTLAGCDSPQFQHNSPGANVRAGAMLIRYAHIAEPPDGPWKPGDDAPLYVWLYNEGRTVDRLLGGETRAARSVEIVTADGSPRGPVEVPPRTLVELEDDRPHLLLRGLGKEVRGGDYVRVTLRFERAGAVTFQVHAQLPTYVDEEATGTPASPSPSASPSFPTPVPTSPSPPPGR
ncbi:copper chaperone PCu(A)C [Streptomyces xinghaiensis]|uniref:copper chaperone PCu(A)C n=1 Tax=Streptomyces xinghaiensis TaxID=1038928 RepID=UPI00031B2525|nr:copper chaperone PCu(A)C [Streptomyces xinghaiensis]